MSYTKTNWQNTPSTQTPISAANLNHMEQGIYDAAQTADSAQSGVDGLDPRMDLVEQRLDNLIPQGTPTEGNAELIDIRVGANGVTYPTAGDAVRGQVTEIKSAIDRIDNIIIGENKYNPALQTSDTISQHYYVNGVPYSTTEFDDQYNCTALIPVMPGKTYTVGLVPAYGSQDVVKPWFAAASGVFGYDINGNFIPGLNTANNTFTTPSNCAFIRFNYYLGSDMGLSLVNKRCMLVEGDALPSVYTGYAAIDQIIYPINYVIDNNGEGVALIWKYNSSYDMAIAIREKGGNNIFDIDSIGLIPNNLPSISFDLSSVEYILSSSGDWHAPFVVSADSNADGDDPTHDYFTGGNHQYNNQPTGSTPTGRTTLLKFYADGQEITSGNGSCRAFTMVWKNRVQAYNTRKSDGTGREVLEEQHRMTFDGVSFEEFIRLIPLENVTMKKWYGLQWFTAPYKNTIYIGGANRTINDTTSAWTYSGDKTCCHVIGYGTEHEIAVDVDADYDLGDHKYFDGADAIFTVAAGKGYFNIIKNTQMGQDLVYSLHGSYKFYPHL